MTMSLPDARKIVASIPADNHKPLDSALERFMRFAGVYCDDDEQAKMAVADRACYPHLVKPGQNPPKIDDGWCAEFMATVSNLPVDWCRAWTIVDFVDARGELSPEEEALMRALPSW